jgi:hypothetical protein
LSREADNKSIFDGNDLAGGALVAVVATKAKKKDLNNYNSVGSFI